VPPGFEPRHHATKKTYRYLVLESVVRDPFLEGRAWRVPDRLNHRAMSDEARALVGQHDFAAFRSTADTRDETVRHVFRVEVRSARSDPRATLIEVEGDRFMHRMVRIIAGMLVDVGRGRLEPGAAERALVSGDRRDLGITAPPGGLYLLSTELDDGGQDGWPEAPRLVDGPPFVA
jgi:tRNA pseudouridine38-40 synthase